MRPVAVQNVAGTGPLLDVAALRAGALGNGVDAGFDEFWWWLPVRVIEGDPDTVE